MRLAEPLDQVSAKGNASARQNPDLRQSPGLPPDLGVPLQPAVPCPRGSPIAQARFGRLPRAPSPTAHCRLLTTLYFRYGADSALPLPGSFFSELASLTAELASLTAELWLRGDQLAPSVTSTRGAKESPFKGAVLAIESHSFTVILREVRIRVAFPTEILRGNARWKVADAAV